MAALISPAMVPILGAVTNTATVALKEGSSLLKHRRENPISPPSKSLSANVTVFGLINNVQPQTDNRDLSGSNENKSSFVEKFLNGAAIGAGIGVGLAGVMWLINKTSKDIEPPQRPLNFAVPGFETGRIVGEQVEGTEEGEERLQGLEEDGEFITLT